MLIFLYHSDFSICAAEVCMKRQCLNRNMESSWPRKFSGKGVPYRGSKEALNNQQGLGTTRKGQMLQDERNDW